MYVSYSGSRQKCPELRKAILSQWLGGSLGEVIYGVPSRVVHAATASELALTRRGCSCGE